MCTIDLNIIPDKLKNYKSYHKKFLVY